MSKTLSLLVGTHLALGILFSVASTAADNHEWRFSEVEGNKIAWSCSGNGEPTIILIAGMGLSTHDSFGRIYHPINRSWPLRKVDRLLIG